MITIDGYDIRSDQTAGVIGRVYVTEERRRVDGELRPTWRTQIIPAGFPDWHRLSRGTVTRHDDTRPDYGLLDAWTIEHAAAWEAELARIAAGEVTEPTPTWVAAEPVPVPTQTSPKPTIRWIDRPWALMWGEVTAVRYRDAPYRTLQVEVILGGEDHRRHGWSESPSFFGEIRTVGCSCGDRLDIHRVELTAAKDEAGNRANIRDYVGEIMRGEVD